MAGVSLGQTPHRPASRRKLAGIAGSRPANHAQRTWRRLVAHQRRETARGRLSRVEERKADAVAAGTQALEGLIRRAERPQTQKRRKRARA